MQSTIPSGNGGASSFEMEALNPQQTNASTADTVQSETTQPTASKDHRKEDDPLAFLAPVLQRIRSIDIASIKNIDFRRLKNVRLEDVRRQADLKVRQLVAFLKLFRQAYPRAFNAIAAILGILILKAIFFPHRGQLKYIPPHLREHYGDIDGYYQLQTAKIDHWCLVGDDHSCTCEDPTEPYERSKHGWADEHRANKKLASDKKYRDVDVVFFGDELVGAFAGKKYGSTADSKEVQKNFESSFQGPTNGKFSAIALGIPGDTIGNLLYRVTNGEIAPKLRPNIFWINIGTNDLVRGGCSAEAVTLGILKLADHINSMRPGTVIVLQSLLPRSTFVTGEVDASRGNTTATHFPHKGKYYSKKQYPLWPTINAINKELEAFCSKQEHLVYFDADNLFMGSMGNRYYQSTKKQILEDLMPDFAHLSTEGFQVMVAAIADEIDRIMYDDDEDNVSVKGKRNSQ